MKELIDLSNNLISLRERIKSIEDRSDLDKLDIIFYDLKDFYNFRGLNYIAVEKEIRNQLLKSDKIQFDLYLTKIKSDINYYFDFYEKYNYQLASLNFNSIIDSMLTYEKSLSDTSYNESTSALDMHIDIKKKLERNFSRIDNSDPEKIILRRKEESAEIERNELREIHSKLFKDYNDKRREYGVYSFINFKVITNDLKKIDSFIDSILNNIELNIYEKKSIVDMKTCAIFYRIIEKYLDENLNELILFNALNLKHHFPKGIKLKKSSKEIFLFTIKCTSESVELNSAAKKEWEDELIKNLGLSINTYRRGNLLQNNETLRDEIRYSFNL